MPRKTFLDGDALPASDLNTFLMNQAVQTYSAPGARDSALPTPLEGQVSTNATTKNLETYYDQWRPLPFAIENRNVAIFGTGAVSASTAITWGTGKFTLVPNVLATLQDASIFYAACTSKTATGATITMRRLDGASFTLSLNVGVLAIQLSNTSTTG
jgi:hypothetical protein